RDHPLADLVAAESLLLAETADRAVYVVVQSRRAIADSPGRGRVPGGFPVVFSDQGSIDFLFVPRDVVVEMQEGRLVVERVVGQKGAESVGDRPVDVARVAQELPEVVAQQRHLPSEIQVIRT